MAKRKKNKGKRLTSKKFTFTTRSPLKSPNAKLLYNINPLSYRKPNLRALVPIKKTFISRYLQNPIVIKRKLDHDRRHWRPKSSPLETYGKRNNRLSYILLSKTAGGKKHHGARLGFKHAQDVEICKRRRRRRVELFRSGKAGRGRKITTPKKLNEYSKIRC